MGRLVEHEMAVAGHRTRVLELDGHAPGIVLLHGWGDSADTWRPLLAELAAAPFDLAAVACPVLLVWGARDRLVPDTGARGVLGALPATRVELIEGCGHAPQLEATERLRELLDGFPA